MIFIWNAKNNRYNYFQTWDNLKSATKQKVRQIRNHQQRTGGGPVCTIILTENDKRIESVCKDSIVGLPIAEGGSTDLEV